MATRHFWLYQGDAVFVSVYWRQNFLCKGIRAIKNLIGIAVVHPKNGRAALSLDANAFEAEIDWSFLAIDGLRIVVKQQERVGRRVDHLSNKFEPIGLKVVPLINEDSPVLRPGDLPTFNRVANSRYQPFEEAISLARFCHVIMRYLIDAPPMEIANDDPLRETPRSH